MRKLLIFLSLILFLSCADNSTNPKKDDDPDDPIVETGPKYEPAGGECLFILGQANEDYMDAYMNKIRKTPHPAGFAFYTSLSNGAVQGDLPRYKAYLDKYPNTALQLAIWTGDRQWGDPGYYLDDIVNGRYDANILALATYCTSFDRPIFIRFGYEFDGWHNAYPPDKYIAAYKYFVDKMCALGVTNVAYVWHSWGVGAYYGTEDYPQYYPALQNGEQALQELWYPGDDYVDWVGLSIFGIGWGDLTTNQVVQYMLSFAEAHEKPVMLAETAAIKSYGGPDPSWVIPNTDWFQNVFKLCERDVVKAFTYINVNWTADNPSSTWGNTQIQSAGGGVIAYWLGNITTFLHGDDQLYEKIGYTE